jgi:glycosyltransferase involved in cell wall biosynthesis
MISVVIPTKGRVDVLRQCIEHLFVQDIDCEHYEILVVDDGTAGEVETMLAQLNCPDRCNVIYLRGPAQGVGPARNKGVLAAKYDIVLIIGNDVIGSEKLLREHCDYHQRYPDEKVIVLGQTKLHPDASKSPIMELWGDLPFWEIEHLEEVPWWYFFTGNISLKKNFFMQYGMFDKSFKRIGFEDTEVGLRLHIQGMKMLYNAKALGYHNHPYTFQEACSQQIHHGYNFGIFIDKVHAVGYSRCLPVLGERYGIIGYSCTAKGKIKNGIKKAILHRKLLMNFLEKIVCSYHSAGPIFAFLCPKVLNYYTNKGFLMYLDDHQNDREGKSSHA